MREYKVENKDFYQGPKLLSVLVFYERDFEWGLSLQNVLKFDANYEVSKVLYRFIVDICDLYDNRNKDCEILYKIIGINILP